MHGGVSANQRSTRQAKCKSARAPDEQKFKLGKRKVGKVQNKATGRQRVCMFRQPQGRESASRATSRQARCKPGKGLLTQELPNRPLP